MSQPFVKLYEEVKRVLFAATAITTLVVKETNIYPGNDPHVPAEGPVIVFGIPSSNWDAKARRGNGVVAVIVGHEQNRIEAQRILDLVRSAITASSLTSAGRVRVQLFKEDDGGSKELDGLTNRRHEVSISWVLKMVDGTD